MKTRIIINVGGMSDLIIALLTAGADRILFSKEKQPGILLFEKDDVSAAEQLDLYGETVAIKTEAIKGPFYVASFANASQMKGDHEFFPLTKEDEYCSEFLQGKINLADAKKLILQSKTIDEKYLKTDTSVIVPFYNGHYIYNLNS